MRFPVRPLLLGAGVVTALGLMTAGCGPAETTATAYLTWQIVDAKSPDPNTAQALTCESKQVAFVRLSLVPGGGNSDFPCSSMAAETLTVNSGIYTVQAIALSSNYEAVAQTTFQQRLFGRTNLGHIIFQVQ